MLTTIIILVLTQHVLKLVNEMLTDTTLAAMNTSSLSLFCSRLDIWLTHCEASPPSGLLAPVRYYVYKTALARGLQVLDQATNDNDGHTRAGALIGLAASFCPHAGTTPGVPESGSDDSRNSESALLPYIQRLVCEEFFKVSTTVQLLCTSAQLCESSVHVNIRRHTLSPRYPTVHRYGHSCKFTNVDCKGEPPSPRTSITSLPSLFHPLRKQTVCGGSEWRVCARCWMPPWTWTMRKTLRRNAVAKDGWTSGGRVLRFSVS